MAKKTRKQKQRTAARRPAGAVQVRPTAAAAPLAGATSRPAAALPDQEGQLPATPFAVAATAPPEGTRRRVERVTPASAASIAASRQQRASAKSARFGTAAAMVDPLDSDDPAIPFDRVPYVPADLRRVAVIASVMVVLILIAWAIVSKFVD